MSSLFRGLSQIRIFVTRRAASSFPSLLSTFFDFYILVKKKKRFARVKYFRTEDLYCSSTWYKIERIRRRKDRDISVLSFLFLFSLYIYIYSALLQARARARTHAKDGKRDILFHPRRAKRHSLGFFPRQSVPTLVRYSSTFIPAPRQLSYTLDDPRSSLPTRPSHVKLFLFSLFLVSTEGQLLKVLLPAFPYWRSERTIVGFFSTHLRAK